MASLLLSWRRGETPISLKLMGGWRSTPPYVKRWSTTLAVDLWCGYEHHNSDGIENIVDMKVLERLTKQFMNYIRRTRVHTYYYRRH